MKIHALSLGKYTNYEKGVKSKLPANPITLFDHGILFILPPIPNLLHQLRQRDQRLPDQ